MYYARALCKRVNPRVFGSNFGDDSQITSPIVQQAAVDWDRVLVNTLPGSGTDAEQRQAFINTCYGAGVGIGMTPEATLTLVLNNIPNYKRLSDASMGDDESAGGPVTQRGGIGTFENVQPLPTTENVQSTQVPVQTDEQRWAATHPTQEAVGQFFEEHLGASKAPPGLVANPFAPIGMIVNPLGIGAGAIKGSPTPSPAKPWIKGAIIIGGVGVIGYALAQVANVTKAIRG